MALYRVEPWGEVRGDLQAAVIAQTVAECFTGKRQKLSSFLLTFDRPRHQSAVEMQAIFRTWVTAHNSRQRAVGRGQ